MEKLELYLIAVSLFGLFIGWFILKEFFRKRDIHSLNGTIKEKEICLKNLEIDCSEKQNKLDRLIDESIVCKHELLQKSNLLRKKSDELYKIQKELDSIRDKILKVKTVENQNRELIYKVSQLEKLQIKPRVGENKSNDVQELQRLRSIIIEKDKLIENRKKDNISYIEISKDQFEQIEKRLKEYKNKANKLEEENAKFAILKSSEKEFDFLKKMNYSIFNIKDVALSNLFRDNSEKLTKA